jgi:hypothetical protein
VLVLLAIEVGAVKEGSGFLPSRRVLSCAFTVCVLSRGVPSRQVLSSRFLSRRVLSTWTASSGGDSMVWRR